MHRGIFKLVLFGKNITFKNKLTIVEKNYLFLKKEVNYPKYMFNFVL